MEEARPKQTDRVEIHAPVQQQKQQRLEARARLHPGHRCWELNLSTGEVKLAELQEVTRHYDPTKVVQLHPVVRKVVMREGHLYLNALNKKNAVKQFKKVLTADGI